VISILKLFQGLPVIFEAETLEKFRAFQELLILSALSHEMSVMFEIVQFDHHDVIHLHWFVGDDRLSVTLHESVLLAYTVQLHVDVVDDKLAVTVFVTGGSLGWEASHGHHEHGQQLVHVATPFI
jgi:hypothetical protein